MEKKGKTFFKGDFGYSKEGLWFENIIFFYVGLLLCMGKIKKWLYSGVFNMMSWNGKQNQIFFSSSSHSKNTTIS